MATTGEPQSIETIATPKGPESLPKETPPDAGSLKRKASLSESVSNDTTVEASRQSEPANRPAAAQPRFSAQDEKKRSKRLFGGLLSTLSQTNKDNATQKRRQEIERRQQERLQKQREELEANYKQNVGAGSQGKTRDFHFSREEAAMRKRHHRLRATARQLSTVTRPRIYYSPARKLAQQEATIARQIHETERTIERELQDLRQRELMNTERRSAETIRAAHVEGTAKEIDQTERRDDPPRGTGDSRFTTRETGPAAPGQPATADEKKEEQNAPMPVHFSHDDESGDEVVEAAEDMVIY